ncbi:MAG: hypothetical protein QOD55_740, partial [Solirubrobacteraceae bacterium]|nr:hypothetical protein [Solirubrobacteraceae bacterium]
VLAGELLGVTDAARREIALAEATVAPPGPSLVSAHGLTVRRSPRGVTPADAVPLAVGEAVVLVRPPLVLRVGLRRSWSPPASGSD